MTKVPDFTPEKWDKWLKDKNYAEDRVEHLEDELDKALDGELMSAACISVARCKGCWRGLLADVGDESCLCSWWRVSFLLLAAVALCPCPVSRLTKTVDFCPSCFSCVPRCVFCWGWSSTQRPLSSSWKTVAIDVNTTTNTTIVNGVISTTVDTSDLCYTTNSAATEQEKASHIADELR